MIAIESRAIANNRADRSTISLMLGSATFAKKVLYFENICRFDSAKDFPFFRETYHISLTNSLQQMQL
jgi:hypothetical protein